MSKRYLLIDFENVQPKAIDRLEPGEWKIKVFLGDHQSKLLLGLVQALQPFGADAEYIQISGSGPDAVDFHIAFYIGRLSASDEAASFTIISKDKGFDPLVKHLTRLGIGCRRLTEIPAREAVASARPASRPAEAKAVATARKSAAAKATAPTTARGRAKLVVERLRHATKPARLTTLRSSIRNFFAPALDDKAVDAVVQSLVDSKKISLDANKVTYSLG